VERLAKEGYKVTVIDDLSTGKMENLEPAKEKVDFIKGSILDINLLADTLKKSIEHVFHQASVSKSIRDSLKTNEVNVTGTLNVLKASVENGIEKAIAASSSSVYGDTQELPKRESMECSPKSPYAVSKLSGEYYLRVFSEVYGIKTIGLRYISMSMGLSRTPYSPTPPLCQSSLIWHWKIGTCR
jgi:UDP-glucose 4-epimerase